jgi:hypothetical protein
MKRAKNAAEGLRGCAIRMFFVEQAEKRMLGFLS